MIIKLAIKVRVQQFEGGKRINFGFSFKRYTALYAAQPAKTDLNKKSFPKQKTIQNFTIDAQGFRKTKNENPPTWEMGVTS